MRIVITSDLHGETPDFPDGDLLIIAGDITATDHIKQWAKFFSWFKEQPHRKKILIAGNHDNFLFKAFPKSKEEADQLKEIQNLLDEEDKEGFDDFEYLCDSGTEFEGLRIWGCPWTVNFFGQNPEAKAFGLLTEAQAEDKFNLIPADTDILVTHAPPYGILDGTRNHRFGYHTLRRVVDRVKPRLHCYGHVHEGYSEEKIGDTIFVNAAHMTIDYKPINKPIVVTL